MRFIVKEDPVEAIVDRWKEMINKGRCSVDRSMVTKVKELDGECTTLQIPQILTVQ